MEPNFNPCVAWAKASLEKNMHDQSMPLMLNIKMALATTLPVERLACQKTKCKPSVTLCQQKQYIFKWQHLNYQQILYESNMAFKKNMRININRK